VGTVDPLGDLVDQLRQEIEARLAPDGWIVEARVSRPPRFSLAFQHPLTSDTSVSLDSTKDYRRTLERFLGSSEFDLVANAPRDVPHARLIRAIRENAKGFEWPPSVTERLALIFELEGILTPEEARWLDTAGAAWALGVHS
jgi:hypothetical protein